MAGEETVKYWPKHVPSEVPTDRSSARPRATQTLYLAACPAPHPGRLKDTSHLALLRSQRSRTPRSRTYFAATLHPGNTHKQPQISIHW